MRCCHKHSAPSVAIPGADRMRLRWSTVLPQSIFARLAVMTRFGALRRLLGREVIPLAESVIPAVAVIDEPACIGCFHCRNACPVDAIVGAHQFMHTVIASECTGCELCVAPCPVDCITMSPLS